MLLLAKVELYIIPVSLGGEHLVYTRLPPSDWTGNPQGVPWYMEIKHPEKEKIMWNNLWLCEKKNTKTQITFLNKIKSQNILCTSLLIHTCCFRPLVAQTLPASFFVHQPVLPVFLTESRLKCCYQAKTIQLIPRLAVPALLLLCFV